MTSEQQKALENLVGRSLTEAEVAYVDSFLPTRDDVSIANLLSVGRTKLVSRMVGIGTILAKLWPNGGAFLDGLEAAASADPNIKWAMKLILADGLDVGMKETRLAMESFAAANSAMASGVATLLALAESPDPINYNDVSDVLNVVDGHMTLGT